MEVKMDITFAISSECYQDSESDILDAASEIARRVLEEIKTLAGTTSCKSVQLVRYFSL